MKVSCGLFSRPSANRDSLSARISTVVDSPSTTISATARPAAGASFNPWPLNPEGELILSLKLEDRECVANCEEIAAVPGIAFGEWGPGDMGMSYGYPYAHDPPYPPGMVDARTRIKAAYKKYGVRFRSGWRDPEMTVEERTKHLIDEGVMDVGVDEEGARYGRQLTNRQMPV